ncbi:MAG TPA: cation:proton antiporter [Leptolyngbyaceae cyanobacterium M33_DOE_097]|uniref:Sodium:proton antiporter n=1 Tax=Oscillatoriales cyanobacterium SpSt-418 TaxID=2282169 RepID=A0A7C3KF04_9CYAN|nr:cation:proton antiporter [Leptolyngbyaceae cyanobacterium M33_DOE_097]
MDSTFDITLQIILTVIAGVSAQVIAEFLRLPGIVFLLLFGILLGPSALGWLRPSLLGNGLEVMVSLLVAIILFEGGFSLELKDLGRVSTSLRNLVTIGTLVTLLGGGMAAHWLSEFPWGIAFLYASLVVVTGPTVITPLLRQVKVDRQVATLLEGEGVLIDPVGAILAVVVLDTLLNSGAEPLSVVTGLLLRLGVGAAIGIIGGLVLSVFLKWEVFLSEDVKALTVLAGLWGLYGLAQTIRSESGLMAAVAAGIVLRASDIPEERLLKRFKGQLTILAVSVLFILLSADLSLPGVIALGWGGVLTVLCLMFIVRPINIGLCTWQSDLNWRQKAFLAWIAPRGIVSASVASLFSILLTQRGVSGGDAIKALVFLTIILTIVVQGLTAGPIANFLQITSKQATGVVIVGCNPLSLLIGRLYSEQGEAVALIDTNPEFAQQAEAENLRLFVSSALETDVLEEAGLFYTGSFLAITANGEVNRVVAQKATEEFRPPRVVAVFPREKQVTTDKKPLNIEQAFHSQVSLKSWNQYLMDGAVKLGETVIQAEKLELQKAHIQSLVDAGSLLPLVVNRNSMLQVVSAESSLQVGDRLIYLLHDPKPKLLKALSGSGKPRLVVEKLSEVENLPAEMSSNSDDSSESASETVLNR